MEDVLLRCGLTKTEQLVLLCLLEHGRRGPALIAKATNLKRTTVYSALESLERRNLVSRSHDGRSVLFAAIPPAQIPAALSATASSQFESLSKAIRQAEAFLKQFPHETQQSIAGFSIRELLGSRSYEAVMMECVTKNDFFAIWDPHTVIRGARVKERIREYLTLSGRRKSRIQEILVASPQTEWYRREISNPNHHIQTFSASAPLDADILILKSAVIISHTTGTGAESALEIQHSSIAHLFQEIFSSWWRTLAQSGTPRA